MESSLQNHSYYSYLFIVRQFQVLANAKVPKEERMAYWILAEGNRAIWIPGIRNSEAYRVTKETKCILVATVDGGKKHER